YRPVQQYREGAGFHSRRPHSGPYRGARVGHEPEVAAVSSRRQATPPLTRVILNPTSRHGSGRRSRPLIQRELDRRGVAYDIVQTEGPGHATELAAEAARDGIPLVVAAGGDGTVHEVANG